MVPGPDAERLLALRTFTVMSAWRATAVAGPLALESAPEAIDERTAADPASTAADLGMLSPGPDTVPNGQHDAKEIRRR